MNQDQGLSSKHPQTAGATAQRPGRGTSKPALAALLLIGLVLMASFQNCGTQEAIQFEADTSFFSRDQAGGEDLPPIPRDTNPTSPELIPEGPGGSVVIRPPVICDPFSQGSNVEQTSGIEGRIYFTGRRLDQSKGECLGTVCGSRDYIAKGDMIPAALFMSAVHVPPRDFNRGFTPVGGQALQDSNGQVLTEFFALDLKSSLVAPPNEPGHYQIAAVSDDGVTVTVDGEDILADEGEHAPRMKCSTRAIDLSQAGARLPLRVTYFQGPRQTISLVLLWRKVDPQNLPKDCSPFDSQLTGSASSIQADLASPLPAAFSGKGWSAINGSSYRIAGQNLCAR